MLHAALPFRSQVAISSRKSQLALISSESRSDAATARATRRNTLILRPIHTIRRGICHRAATGSNQTPDHDRHSMSSSSDFAASPKTTSHFTEVITLAKSLADNHEGNRCPFSSCPPSWILVLRRSSMAGRHLEVQHHAVLQQGRPTLRPSARAVAGWPLRPKLYVSALSGLTLPSREKNLSDKELHGKPASDARHEHQLLLVPDRELRSLDVPLTTPLDRKGSQRRRVR